MVLILANWSKYLLRADNSFKSFESTAPQNTSRKRHSSSSMAFLPVLSSMRPYLMVRSINSCARAKALSARLCKPFSNAI